MLQLLNQWESPGSPPASNEDIDNLPVVTIAQEHIGVCAMYSYQPVYYLYFIYMCKKFSPHFLPL